MHEGSWKWEHNMTARLNKNQIIQIFWLKMCFRFCACSSSPTLSHSSWGCTVPSTTISTTTRTTTTSITTTTTSMTTAQSFATMVTSSIDQSTTTTSYPHFIGTICTPTTTSSTTTNIRSRCIIRQNTSPMRYQSTAHTVRMTRATTTTCTTEQTTARMLEVWWPLLVRLKLKEEQLNSANTWREPQGEAE